MWNDTDWPLAYFITFQSYGTWLKGDERGSTDRFQNIYRTPHIAPNLDWQRYNAAQLKGEPVVLTASQRIATDTAIRETCEIRRWQLQALNVRTNHVHSMVSIGVTKPGVALNAFKANATRQMRQSGCWEFTYSPWADRGSKRRLWNERSVARAIDYVINGQGDDLPDFDQ